MKNSMGRRLTALFVMLFAVVLVVWIAFYFIISRQIYADAEKRTELAAGQIMDTLGTEFMNLEQVSFSLVQNESVRAFVTEDAPSLYYALGDQIFHILENSRYNPDLVGHVMLYNENGEAYRLAGTLSNSSCARVWRLAADAALPEHLVTKLEDSRFIGYANGIHNEAGERTGLLVMLIEEQKLLELIERVSPKNELLVAVSARGEIVTANTEKFPEKTEKPGAAGVAFRHVGLTPFEILVAADEAYLSKSTRYFTMAAVITAVIFGALLVIFIQLLNRRFLSPMIRVIGHVEALDANHDDVRLPPVQSEEFDSLVAKINDMLIRLDKQNKEVQAAELRAVNAEIQHQKDIIFSLKKQINAHFTINTLSAIQLLVERGDIKRAGIILRDLSALVRYAYAEDEWIGVWDEFQMIGYYVAIMNVRYDDRVEIDFDLDDRLMDCRIPRMLLQPIIENTLTHGFSGCDCGSRVAVKAVLQDGDMVISIRDNGRGIKPEALAKLRRRLDAALEEQLGGIESIALVNIKRRIESYYGQGGRLEIISAPGKGTAVTLMLCAAFSDRESS